jgi:hypothetical protein
VKVDGVLKVLGADYTVTGVGLSNGGNVVFLAAPANGAAVQRARKVPYTRSVDYQNNGDFQENTVDSDFDLLEMQVQQIAADAARALKAPLSVTADQVMTDIDWASRASKVIGFDALGSLKTYAPASAVTDAANVNYLATLAGALSRTQADKNLDVVSAFEWFTAAQIADVRARTKLLDVTAALNAAFAYGSNNNVAIYLPAGTYKVTDTLWATPSGSVFQSCHILGAGRGFASTAAQTIIDASTITSKPAINVTRGRGCYLGHFLLQGGGKSIETDYAGHIEQMLYGAVYVSGGFRDSRYSPHCGIAVDAGVGALPPDGGYAGFAYQNVISGTADITLDQLTIRQFVVGFMHNPESNAQQGDTVLVNHCQILDTKVGIAVGQAQARGITVIGGNIGWCRTCYDGQEYGQLQGNGPVFIDTQFGPAFEIFEGSLGFNPMQLVGGRCESVHRIGAVGQGVALSAFPVILDGFDCHLLNREVFDGSAGGKRCPIVLENAAGATIWKGGFLGDDSAAGADSFIVMGEPCILEGVLIGRMVNKSRPYIGGIVDFNQPTELRNCRVIDGGGATIIGDDVRRFSHTGRYNAHWGENLVRDRNYLYQYVPGAGNTYVNIGVLSNIVFAATTLAFDNTDTPGIQVGDLVMWRFNLVGKSALKYIAPAAKVTGIVGATVTCALLYPRAYYDEAYAPGTASIVVTEWAPAQVLTGDLTNANAVVNNVNPTTILQNGDWVAGAGIAANTRVAAGGGTNTVTLSRNATATLNSAKLAWGGLKNLSVAGVSADNGDASKVLYPRVDSEIQRWATALTANRTVTPAGVSTTRGGDRFILIREAGGAFDLAVAGMVGAFSLAPNQWAEIRYDDTVGAWRVYARGYLHTAERIAVGADVGDAAKTIVTGRDERTQIWATPLTANRAVTLSATNAYAGARWRIVRKATATGASTLDVGAGPLKSLAVGQWCEVEYDGAAWLLVAFGAL